MNHQQPFPSQSRRKSVLSRPHLWYTFAIFTILALQWSKVVHYPITHRVVQSSMYHVASPNTSSLKFTSTKQVRLDKPKAQVQEPDDDHSWSPACRPTWGDNPSKITRVYFAHTRKAGGTFMRSMLETFARQHNLTFAAVEGDPVESPKRNDTLYVTNLRHPVSRVISHYKYDGRWGCSQTMRQPNHSLPTAENAQSLKGFVTKDPFVGTPPRMFAIPCSPSVPPMHRSMWVCAKNCYLRWYSKDFNCLRNVTDSFETAVENLSQFNLIVVTERLQDPVYWHGLARMFGFSNTTTFRKSAFCDPESKFWNKKFPLVISNETMAFVHQVNHRDTELFHHLTHCRNQEVFPELPAVFSSVEP